jgi:PAS domain S-box-containing protein
MEETELERESPLVLVVDDDISMRLLERTALEQAGFAVEEAEDGVLALSAYERIQPDAVLLDVMMPELDGFSTCAEIRKLPGGNLTPIFIVTGLDDLDSIGRAYEVGATDFIVKPINWGILGHHVRYMLRAARALASLQQSEARYRAVVEQSADGIYLVDAKINRIIEANPAFAQMLGYSEEEILGLSISDFVAADRGDVDRRFQAILEGEAPFFYEHQYRRKDGSLLDVWASAKAISYGGREVVCSLVRDLTEKKAVEAQSLRAQRMESLGMLAGGIAHDLNNILAPILMNVELLQKNLTDPQGQKMLSSVYASAQRGAGIVRQILTFSRGTEGERSILSPKYLLKEMFQIIQETFPKSLCIETKTPQDLWSLYANATQLHQVLLNLCVNAKDAMPNGGTLTIAGENVCLDESYARMHPEAKVGPYVLFSVSDTGKGIPPAILDRIFDPFFTTKERGHGTGLGLSTVHSIVKGHGGFLTVYSEVGKGSRFQIYLPALPSGETPRAEQEEAPLPSGHGEMILVADDETSIREITQTTLEEHGYRTMTASDGSEAVALYAQHPDEIEAVITDMAMPIMNGQATIRALQRIQPAVRVIAISGMAWDKPIAEAIGGAVKAFLQKPFTADTLLRALHKVLAGK